MTPPSPSPSPSPLTDFTWWPNPPTPAPAPTPSGVNTPAAVIQQSSSSSPPPPRLPVDFSPPLIAMVVVVAAAFLVVTYSRLISRHLIPPLLRLLRRRRRRRPSSAGGGDLDSLPYYDSPFDASDGFHVLSPYGLDDSVIKTIPLSIYTAKRNNHLNTNTRIVSRDCAVCLIEFDEDDYVRTLPVCSHAFHVDCIDMWLRSHANCPLCRAAIFSRTPDSPFVPLMAARIRPSLDDAVLRSIALEQAPLAPESASSAAATEITPCVEEMGMGMGMGLGMGQSPEERAFGVAGRDFLLKRSYSFGFERSAASERMMMMATEPATASPWRYHGGRRVGGFWSKRPSPFGSLSKPRVFSFRYYRGMKSPFFRRSRGFFTLSESSSRFSGGGGSSRRTKSMTSPMFMRPSAATATAFSSSRLRCGDPEALLSPERFNRR